MFFLFQILSEEKQMSVEISVFFLKVDIYLDEVYQEEEKFFFDRIPNNRMY